MLKKYELKNQLRGLTVLLLISLIVILSGCGFTSKSAKTFYPEYYAARQLQNQDIVKLRELTVNPDLFVADSATLLLGSYYLYYGDENYGRLLIDKSYNSKNLNEEMTIFGKLWKMESLLREGEKGAAINLSNQVKEMRRTPVYMRVMQIYCNQYGVLVIGDGEINSCIDVAVNGKQKFQDIAAKEIENQDLPIVTDDMSYEEYLKALGIGGAVDNIDGKDTVNDEIKNVDIKPDAKIKIAGGDIFDDVASGIIYGMGKYNNNYQLEPVSDFAADENSKTDMLLRLNNYDLFIGGVKSNLGVDYLQLSEVATGLNIVTNKSMAVIVTSEHYQAHGKIIADSFKSKGKKAFQIDIKNHQEEMGNVLNGKNKSSYIIIIIADEKEILEVLPIAKYHQVNSSLQDVLIMTAYIPEYDITDDQRSYFKGTYILTSSYLVNNPEYKRVAADFKGFYGMPLSGKGALGYDIITYINKIVNKDTTGKYITDIEKIVNGYAIRSSVLLYSDGRKLIEKAKYKPKEYEGEELLP